jgi:Mce-associated membrane protein
VRTETAVLSEPEAADEVDEGEATDEVEDTDDGLVAEGPSRRRLRLPRSETTRGLLVGLLCTCLLAGLVAWLGIEAQHARAAGQQRQLFLQAGRQAALDLTTVSATDVDADIKRVLDASTGQFHDEFSSRAPAFAAAVREAKSTSTGVVSEAGIESIDGDTARVLVSTAVRTATAQGEDQQARHWRMRITVKKIDEDLPKVADVEFVP